MKRVCAALALFLGVLLSFALERSAFAEEVQAQDTITAEIDKAALDNGG